MDDEAEDMTPHLHIIGVDPGGGTGVARLTVPRASIFGDDMPEIWDTEFRKFNGPEVEQVMNIARFVRETQSLDYKTGPAILSEQWDDDPTFNSTDQEALSPCRINAMLQMMHHLTTMHGTVSVQWLGDATLNFQPRALAMQTFTDDMLKQRGLYGSDKDIKAAVKHALTGLRRAAQNQKFARQLWPN